ncbi:hypothetical protein CTI14_71980, partial [Methylobacterium radiotolerans]
EKKKTGAARSAAREDAMKTLDASSYTTALSARRRTPEKKKTGAARSAAREDAMKTLDASSYTTALSARR